MTVHTGDRARRLLLVATSLSIQHGHSKGHQVRFRRHRLPRSFSPSPSSSFARRKAFAIKHQEAEPLTRRDLQYDFLYHVFAAQERVFTDPTLSPKEDGGGDGGGGAVTFRDLYVHALMSSPRCSKALREKMQETPEFATDFAKMSLLANVGRVNTTMTCLCPFCSSIYHLLTAAPPKFFRRCARHYVLIIPSLRCRKQTRISKTPLA